MSPVVWWSDSTIEDEIDEVVRQTADRRLVVTDEFNREASIVGYFAYESEAILDGGPSFEIRNVLSGVHMILWNIIDILKLPENITQRVRTVAKDKFAQTRMILAKPMFGITDDTPFPGAICQIILSEIWHPRQSEQNYLGELLTDVFSLIHAMYSLTSDRVDKTTLSFMNYVTRFMNRDYEKLTREFKDYKRTVIRGLNKLNIDLQGLN